MEAWWELRFIYWLKILPTLSSSLLCCTSGTSAIICTYISVLTTNKWSIRCCQCTVPRKYHHHIPDRRRVRLRPWNSQWLKMLFQCNYANCWSNVTVWRRVPICSCCRIILAGKFMLFSPRGSPVVYVYEEELVCSYFMSAKFSLSPSGGGDGKNKFPQIFVPPFFLRLG